MKESLGHGLEDESLNKVGTRISDALRPQDFVVRFTSDKVSTLCEKIDSLEAAI